VVREINTSVNMAGIEFKNPIMPASGTFGSGQEYSELIDLNQLGAVVTKGVSRHPWEGNPSPRIMETSSGMINAVGLQNPGIDVFLERDIPFLKQFDTKIIVNVCGNTVEEYLQVVERLSEQDVAMLEINISCPNVEHGGIAFGQEPKMVEYITREIKKIAKQPISMKLTPNVTDITEIAKAAEYGGADVISLINTITGMRIDVKKELSVLQTKQVAYLDPLLNPSHCEWFIKFINRWAFLLSVWAESQLLMTHWNLLWQVRQELLLEQQTLTILMLCWKSLKDYRTI